MLELRVEFVLGRSRPRRNRSSAFLLYRICSGVLARYLSNGLCIQTSIRTLKSVALFLLQSRALSHFFIVVSTKQGLVDIFIVSLLDGMGNFFG